MPSHACAWRVCVVACPLPRLPVGAWGSKPTLAGDRWGTVFCMYVYTYRMPLGHRFKMAYP